jgi:predicted nucleotidyltransferase
MDSVVEQIQFICAQYPVDRVILFGSRAGKEYSERSDYDIAIFYQELDPQTKISLYFAIQNLETLKKIDIVWVGTNERPGEQILHSIVTGGRTIYERAS